VRSYLVLVIALSLATPAAISQQIPKESPKGFDSLRKGIAIGKLDMITCSSKTVGAYRRVLPKRKNILCCTFCMALL